MYTFLKVIECSINLYDQHMHSGVRELSIIVSENVS